MNALKTKHNLDFLVADWPRNKAIKLFKVGTMEGQWFSTEDVYVILSFMNNEPGNGHLDDVFEWFEFSCKRDKKPLMILELMNDRFKKHLIEKRGFEEVPGKPD